MWLKALNREDWVPNPSAVVCSKHFGETDFNNTYCSGRALLRPNAVPRFFLQGDSDSCNPYIQFTEESHEADELEEEEAFVKSTKKCPAVIKVTIDTSTNDEKVEIFHPLEFEAYSSKKQYAQDVPFEHHNVYSSDRETSDSNTESISQDSFDSQQLKMHIEKLKIEIKNVTDKICEAQEKQDKYRLEIRSWQQRNNRLERRLKTLNEVFLKLNNGDVDNIEIEPLYEDEESIKIEPVYEFLELTEESIKFSD